MTPKKVYYYDYHTTLDVKPQEIKTVPETPVVPATPPTPPTPPSTPVSYPVTPSFLPTLLIVILVSAIIYLIYSLIPKNYPDCAAFPGSKISSVYPGVCTTFYGQSFSRDIETPSALDQKPDYSNDSLDVSDQINTDSVIPSTLPTNETDESMPQTTKGGLPITTPTTKPAPTAKPTPSTKTTTGSNDGSASHPLDWIKHRYPTQKIAFYLPPRFTSTNVTRNLDTQVSTFTIYDSNRSVIQVTLQNDWQNTQNAQNQSLTFMLSNNTGVIKLVSGNQFNYYFTHQNLIYIFSCTIDSTTCDTVVKSLEFI